jgi:hypothetical protein
MIFAVIIIWRKPLFENLGSRILKTKVEIKSVEFIPYKLAFRLINIKVPKENIFIPEGMFYLIPLNLELYGVKARNTIDLKKESFTMKIYRKWGWKFDVFVKDIDLKKFDSGIKKGFLNGHISGKYGKKVNFYGLVTINNIVLAEGQDEFFGIPSFDVENIVKKYNGKIELDFTYNGPVSDVNNLTRYKPGTKTMRVIKTYLLQNIF